MIVRSRQRRGLLPCPLCDSTRDMAKPFGLFLPVLVAGFGFACGNASVDGLRSAETTDDASSDSSDEEGSEIDDGVADEDGPDSEGSGGGDSDESDPGDDGSNGSDSDGEGGADDKSTLPSILVLQGQLGTLMVSCDDGRTFPFYRDDGVDYDCGSVPEGGNCDHTTGSAKGLAAGDGVFLANFGWGAPTSFLRSTDGMTWEQVYPYTTEDGEELAGRGIGGIGFADNQFISSGGTTIISADRGDTWFRGGQIKFAGGFGHIRGYASLTVNGEDWVFFVGAVNGTNVGQIFMTHNGEDVITPSSKPDRCGLGVGRRGGVVTDGARIVAIGRVREMVDGRNVDRGYACVSTDGGDTWVGDTMPVSISSHAAYTGSEFVVFSPGKRISSPDGVTWAVEDGETIPGSRVLVASPTTGALIAAGSSRTRTEQPIHRSEDGGRTWMRIAHGHQGHGLVHGIFGQSSSSELCGNSAP